MNNGSSLSQPPVLVLFANEYYKFSNYQFRGISVPLAYQLAGNADLELRQIIPVDAYDELTLSVERFSTRHDLAIFL